MDNQRPRHVDECAEAKPSGAQDGPQPCSSPLTVQTYCDASFAPGGGRSRSGILVLLVDEEDQQGVFCCYGSLDDRPSQHSQRLKLR